MKTRILFFNPPGKRLKVEPLGMEYLISALRVAGFNSSLLDASIDNLDIRHTCIRLKEYSPDMVGVSITTPGLVNDIKGVRLIKQVLPEAKIIAGGPHPSADPQGLLRAVPEIDLVVIGEGEDTIVELLFALEKNTPLSEVNGLAFRKDNDVVVSGPRKLRENIDSLPFPCRENIDYKKVFATLPFGRRRPFAIMVTGRGCPYACIFCSKSVFGKSCRLRSPENVIAEIEELCLSGIKEIRFYDDSFTINPARAMAICDKIIESRVDLAWSCESRVDTISEELLVKMKESGCYNLTFGVESGSESVLEKSHKSISVEQIRRAFRLTREIGIESGAWLMFGLPGRQKIPSKKHSGW